MASGSPKFAGLRSYAHLIVLGTVLATSLALNVKLATDLRGSQPRLEPAGIKLEATIADVPVMKLDGTRTVLDLSHSDRPTAIYVLSSVCGWCLKNYNNIVTLKDSSRQDIKFIGLAIGKDLAHLRQHLQENPLPFEVYYVDSETVRKQLRLTATPQLAVVGADGVVQQAWHGAFAGNTRKDIETKFGVKLMDVALR